VPEGKPVALAEGVADARVVTSTVGALVDTIAA
jgi:hypothetical protein